MNKHATPFYDSHMHATSLAKKAPALLAELKQAITDKTIQNCLDIGINPGDHTERLPLLRDLGIAWYSVGLYPSHAGDATLEHALQEQARHIQTALAALTASPRLVAIGEIGLDLFHKYATLEQQKDLFGAQLAMANDFNLPVIIHNREANAELIECISRCPPQAGGILHCFSADWPTAVKLLDYNFKFSFAGNISYKSAIDLRDIAKKLPANCLLAETDSPYLSPEPVRGKPNWPYNVRYVYDCLAEIRSLPLAELCLQIQENLADCLRLPLPLAEPAS